MIKKLLPSIFLVALLFSVCYVQSQIITVPSGSNFVITPGTKFSVDNLVIEPSANFSLDGLSISRSATVTHTSLSNYIARVYQFSANSDPFSGTIQINYQDGAELNGIPEADLEVNVHNGTLWQYYTSSTNDITNNYVLSTSVSGLTLNEITLAARGSILPLQWQSFTTAKEDDNVLLEWSTFSEHNTKNFVVQTSTDGITWKSIATVASAGNSTSVNHYSYLHTSPTAGKNYYRILQTDLDGHYNYSIIRNVIFDLNKLAIQVLSNPVVNGMLQIKVNTRITDLPPVIKLYTLDGKLLWTKKLDAGIHSIPVSNYSKGTYFLKAGSITKKILLQ